MTDTLARYGRALDHFSALVHAVGPDQWRQPTPCADWDVRALVNHVAVEQLWAPPLMGGATVASVGDRLDGDQLGEDPVAVWDGAAANARTAFSAQGALERDVHLSYGDTPAERYCQEMTMDLVVHGWDLARGVGADDTLDPEVAELLLARLAPHVDVLAASGLFAAPLPVADGADAQTRLLALLGRRA